MAFMRGLGEYRSICVPAIGPSWKVAQDGESDIDQEKRENDGEAEDVEVPFRVEEPDRGDNAIEAPELEKDHGDKSGRINVKALRYEEARKANSCRVERGLPGIRPQVLRIDGRFKVLVRPWFEHTIPSGLQAIRQLTSRHIALWH